MSEDLKFHKSNIIIYLRNGNISIWFKTHDLLDHELETFKANQIKCHVLSIYSWRRPEKPHPPRAYVRRRAGPWYAWMLLKLLGSWLWCNLCPITRPVRFGWAWPQTREGYHIVGWNRDGAFRSQYTIDMLWAGAKKSEWHISLILPLEVTAARNVSSFASPLERTIDFVCDPQPVEGPDPVYWERIPFVP